MKEEELEKIKLESWRKGYNLGMKNTIRQNSLAIQIGSAIIQALDERYEFKNEDY